MQYITMFIGFLDEHSGSLTLIVTTIYAWVTYRILKANSSSAEAAKQQLNEMKRQYDEENRPNIEVELVVLRNTALALRFVNHGKRTAQKVSITVSQEFVESLKNRELADMIIRQRGKTCVIGTGQHYDLYICDMEYMRGSNRVPVSGSVSYSSDSASYSSEYYMDLSNYMSYFSLGTTEKSISKILQEQTRELTSINNSLQGIKTVLKEEGQE